MIQNCGSYIKDTGNILWYFIYSGRGGIISQHALWGSIPYEAFREALDKQGKKSIPIEDLVKMAEFLLKNNFFEFNTKIKRQVSGTAVGTKFPFLYACHFKDKFETSFLETQKLQLQAWFRYLL